MRQSFGLERMGPGAASGLRPALCVGMSGRPPHGAILSDSNNRILSVRTLVRGQDGEAELPDVVQRHAAPMVVHLRLFLHLTTI